jgi:hypothetical protein
VTGLRQIAEVIYTDGILSNHLSATKGVGVACKPQSRRVTTLTGAPGHSIAQRTPRTCSGIASSLALGVQVRDAKNEVVETQGISPRKLDLPIGYWKWAQVREFP